jgi:pantoate kinase
MRRVSTSFPTTFPEDLDDFFSLSKQFARKSGLLTPEVLHVLEICDEKDVPASMTMLGNGVFAYGRRARAVLLPFGEVFECRMADTGAHIVEEHYDTP